ncbi:hypothetical protein TELCIR_14766 [Teladorsagia circumcincta]|uniref:Uncharacterized protein n=1 Tax=Teladorsagia circumcincta TaxID=45464 RepID=A0A2G9U012_TELCI|nr:hypothetical protein TELCIR_14766 [Teladorsagia circumcincta]
MYPPDMKVFAPKIMDYYLEHPIVLDNTRILYLAAKWDIPGPRGMKATQGDVCCQLVAMTSRPCSCYVSIGNLRYTHLYAAARGMKEVKAIHLGRFVDQLVAKM